MSTPIFKCPSFIQWFYFSDELLNHTVQVHPGKSCTLCKRIFTFSEEAIAHCLTREHEQNTLQESQHVSFILYLHYIAIAILFNFFILSIPLSYLSLMVIQKWNLMKRFLNYVCNYLLQCFLCIMCNTCYQVLMMKRVIMKDCNFKKTSLMQMMMTTIMIHLC